VSNGGAETPPARVVLTRRTRTLTCPLSSASGTERVPQRRMNRRHVDVVVISANVSASSHSCAPAAEGVDGLEQRRGQLAGPCRLDPVRAASLGADPDDRFASRSGGVEARSDDRDAALVTQRVVDHVPKMIWRRDSGVLHQRGRLVDLNRPRSLPQRSTSAHPVRLPSRPPAARELIAISGLSDDPHHGPNRCHQ